MGMDYNFLQSVIMASAQYCWIVGNDDVPTDSGIIAVMKALENYFLQNIDIIVTPFSCYDYDRNYVNTVYPLGIDIKQEKIFNTRNTSDMSELLNLVHHNSALFGFLSNVIFKREIWIQHMEMFKDKMNSIFIQMYMNIQALVDGAKYLYLPYIIVNNFIDDSTNQTLERRYRITIGLYGVISQFFKGEDKRKFQKIMIDEYISGVFFELPEDDYMRKDILRIPSIKNSLYSKYFINIADRKSYFNKKNIVIYGAGTYGKKALEKLKELNANILGFCDVDKNKQGKYLSGFIVFDFKRLIKYYNELNCVIVVANNKALEDIVNKLISYKIENIALIT